ncbi:MAG TPA: MFS transporter [Thermodesulfobacteriota bacterium]|nr:MFS transporter [Thermodesulfobacteriota bacterium]
MNKRLTFGLCMGISLGFIFMNIPPALDRLMDLYGATYLRISILISTLFWSHALMQVPAGMIGDRLGIRPTLLIGLCCLCLGNLIPILSPHLGPAILGRVITGIGTGLSFVSTMKLITISAPSQRVGMFQGFYGSLFSLGGILAYLFLPPLIKFHWEWTYATSVGMNLLLILWLSGLRMEKVSPSVKPLPLVQVLRLRDGWVLGSYHALSWGAMITLGSWLPSLLADVWRGPATAHFAWGGALVMFISGLGRLSGSFILLRFTPVRVANESILILSGILLALFIVPYGGSIFALALLAAWFASINFGAFFDLASRSVSSDSLGSLVGFINFLANLSAMLLAILFGWLKDTVGSFSWAFLLMAIFGGAVYLTGRNSLKRHLSAG